MLSVFPLYPYSLWACIVLKQTLVPPTHQVQELIEISLHALDNVHAEHVPSILMLQWLLGRAPHLRSLLLKRGVLDQAFRRLDRAEAKGFGPGERAMQYAALFLAMGLLFA